jgi:hypothetical protein
MKNDHLEQEPFVVCSDCGRKQHQICVLHHDQIWPIGFCCDNCFKMKGAKRKENKFCAKKLPTSKLGIYIETRVNNFLKKKEAGAGEVHIRVVASSDKVSISDIIYIFLLMLIRPINVPPLFVFTELLVTSGASRWHVKPLVPAAFPVVSTHSSFKEG